MGQRQEMTWLEREHAYGYTIVPVPHEHSLVITIKALPGRHIRLSTSEGHVVAELEIAGKASVLGGVYVSASNGIFPGVEFIQLSGCDIKTGEAVTEIIRP